MSAIQSYENNLRRALKSKRPIIHIETYDYDWEYKTINKILAQNAKLGMYSVNHINFSDRYRWTPNLHYQMDNGKTLPLVVPAGGNEIVELLDNFIGLDSSRLLVIFDIAYFLEGETEPGIDACTIRSSIISRLFSFYSEQDSPDKSIDDRSVIILLCPKFGIPPELQNRIYRLTPPYPDEEDIEIELGFNKEFYKEWKSISRQLIENNGILLRSNSNDSIQYSYKPSFFAREKDGRLVDTNGKRFEGIEGQVLDQRHFELSKKHLLSAFQGMRIRSIQMLLSYNDEPYQISGADLDFLLESKKRMVRDSGLLKLEEVKPGSQFDVGDIDGLKDYLEKEKKIILKKELYCRDGILPLPKGLLLVGPPGCGKSATSKAIADILEISLLSLDMGKISSKWVGESEHNFENAIALAEAAQPCVLRIDELEKAFANTGENSSDQSSMKILGFFLTWMQERCSLVYLVATANDLSQLRPEFLRKGRWDEIFYLTYPSAEGMQKIITATLNKYKLKIDEVEDVEHNSEAYILSKCQDVFKLYPKNKISGAVIADSIERVYRERFLKGDGTKEVTSIEMNEIYNVLIEHAKKPSDPEIERKVDSDFQMYKMEYLKTHQPLSSKQINQIRDKINEKYSESNRKRIRDVEAQRCYIELQLSKLKDNSSSGYRSYSSKDQLSEIKKLISEEYDDQYFARLIEDEINDITISHYLSNGLGMTTENENKMKELLRAKYEADRDIEIFYKSKGYISASKGFD